jgi:NAD-dependent dihydropyrimidine dehydrogenase PreA subunit
MTHVIMSPCIGVKSGDCIGACPVDAIHPKPDEPGYADAKQLFIDPKACIDCRACTAVCPVEAIAEDHDVPPEQSEFIAANKAFFEENE